MTNNRLLLWDLCLINRIREQKYLLNFYLSRVYHNADIRILQNSCSSVGSFNDIASTLLINWNEGSPIEFGNDTFAGEMVHIATTADLSLNTIEYDNNSHFNSFC